VALCDQLPGAEQMQALAAEIGYSETVFAAPVGDDWRVRYFAPAMEIPFCGHATIALGSALALVRGNGAFRLHLNDVLVTVEGQATGSTLAAAFQSPPTRSSPVSEGMLNAFLDLFSYKAEELNPRLPPAIVEAGARHLLLALKSRSRLRDMHYDFDPGAKLMLASRLATVTLVYAQEPTLFHARNPFAGGGVYEDPATGAAAAALAGYLRELDWPHGGSLEILQGEDMGVPCRLHADIGPGAGSSIRVSGTARIL
jgi:PhzF family phenazine biosynthesis protein